MKEILDMEDKRDELLLRILPGKLDGLEAHILLLEERIDAKSGTTRGWRPQKHSPAGPRRPFDP